MKSSLCCSPVVYITENTVLSAIAGLGHVLTRKNGSSDAKQCDEAENSCSKVVGTIEQARSTCLADGSPLHIINHTSDCQKYDFS